MTRRSKNISGDIRIEICRRFEDGKSIVCISQEFKSINIKTITSIIRIYRSTGRTNKKNKDNSGRQLLLNDECKEFVKDKIREDVSITLNKLKIKLREEKNVNASISTIHRAIGSFNYSFKRIQLIPAERNSQVNIAKRYDYAASFLLKDEDKFIFIDEMGIGCSARHSSGWSSIGTTPRKVVQSIR
jgi:transposase